MTLDIKEEVSKRLSSTKKQPTNITDLPSPLQIQPANIPLYFSLARQSWYLKANEDEWIEATDSAVKRFLKSHGYRSDIPEGSAISPLDRKLLDTQLKQHVVYAGQLAGYRSGIHMINGQRVLVTKSPALPHPSKGKCDRLKTLIRELLGAKQSVYFAGWLQCALRSLYNGPPFRPGQVLVLAGPRQCGKSLLQKLLTVMFGGRSDRPYPYMIGDTTFNSNLLRAEHLIIEDEASSTDIRARRHFGSMIKNMLFNEVVSLHPKGKESIPVSVFWRITMSVNDEAENLLCLPPLDDSLVDKLMLFRASPITVSYKANDLDGRSKFWLDLVSEIPALMHHILKYRLPDRLFELRCGVRSYQDDSIVRELLRTKPEQRLEEYIDLLLFGVDSVLEWSGTSLELEQTLKKADRTGDVNKLLYFPTACGVYLARLREEERRRLPASESDDSLPRYDCKRNRRGQTVWYIRRPKN